MSSVTVSGHGSGNGQESMPKDRLVEHVKGFLRGQLAPDAPVLLAFSGGGDSLALLYLLLECKKELSITLHLAHVDHGWRKGGAGG